MRCVKMMDLETHDQSMNQKIFLKLKSSSNMDISWPKPFIVIYPIWRPSFCLRAQPICTQTQDAASLCPYKLPLLIFPSKIENEGNVTLT